jgi:hypothetical protein
MTLYVVTRPIIFSGEYKITQTQPAPAEARTLMCDANRDGLLVWSLADTTTGMAVEELTGLEIPRAALRLANRPRITPAHGDSVLLVRPTAAALRDLESDQIPRWESDLEYVLQEFAATRDQPGRPPGESADKVLRIEQARELLAAGLSRRQIAEEMGVSRSTVYSWLPNER